MERDFAVSGAITMAQGATRMRRPRVPGAGDARARSQGGKERPYKASGTQTGTANSVTGEFDVVGPMIASHLGKGSVRTVGRFRDYPNPFENNTYTADNGDELYSTGALDILPIPDGFTCPDVPGYANFGPYSATINFNEGTGRFATATGQAITVGCVYFGAEISPGTNDYPFYVTYSETGWLSY